MSLILTALLTVVGLILGLLFNLVSFSYNMIIALASIDLFGGYGNETGTSLSTLTTRLYVLLGVFMLFKVGFSMLQYITSPDKMTDKQSGIGNIIKRTIISLIILVMFTPVLNVAMDLQRIVLEENILGRIILGVSGDSRNYQKNFGDILPSTIITSLTSINDNWAEGHSECQAFTGMSVADLNTISKESSSELNSDAKKCISAIDDELGDISFSHLMVYENFSDWFMGTVIGAGTGLLSGDRVFSNNFLLFFVLGIAFIYCLLSIALQVGVRVIKIAFMALIAPIPIISYIEPKGASMFTKWAKEFGKTYLMLFIRLAVLYFAILIIILVSNTTVIGGSLKDYSGEDVTSSWLASGQLKIVLFLAAFLFVDQVPKLIENIFGLKMEGGMFKTPVRQLRESKSLMGTVGGAVGAGFGAARALPQLSKVRSQFGKVSTGLNNKFGEGLSKDKFLAGARAYGNLAHKGLSSVANVGRSAKMTAKDLQENKQGFFEGIVDSQTKAAKEGYNKFSRVGTSMVEKLLGKDLPKKEEQEHQKVISKAAGSVVSGAEDETVKKNPNYKQGQIALDGLKKEYEEAAASGKDKAILDAEQKVLTARNTEAQLKANVDNLRGQKAQINQDKMASASQYQVNEARIKELDGLIANAQAKGISATNLVTERARMVADNEAIVKKMSSADVEISRIDSQISAENAKVTTAENDVTRAQTELNTVTAGFESRMSEMRERITTEDKALDDAKKFYTSQKIEERYNALYDKDNGIKVLYDRALSSGSIPKDMTMEEYIERAETKTDLKDNFGIDVDNDFRQFVENMSSLENNLGYEEFEKIKQGIAEIQNDFKGAKFDSETGKYITKEGKIVNNVKIIKDGDNHDIGTIDFRSIFKEVADMANVKEQTLGREISEIEAGTKGMGIVNEVVNMGDFGGPGPGNP